MLELLLGLLGGGELILGWALKRWPRWPKWIGNTSLVAGVLTVGASLWLFVDKPVEWKWSQDEQRRLVGVLRDHPMRFPVILIPVKSSSPSQTYSEYLLRAFREAGWPEAGKVPSLVVNNQPIDSTVNSDTRGLHVVVSSHHPSLSPHPQTQNIYDAAQLRELLTQARIQHKTVHASSTEDALWFIERVTGRWGFVGIVIGVGP